MGHEREKTNPDYPVTPAWRPASQPGVRLPAPSLEPADPPTEPQQLPLAPGVTTHPVHQAPDARGPTSHSSYSLVPASQETILPLSHRPTSAVMNLGVPAQPAFVAPSIAPIAPASPAPTHRAASQPTFRPASDGYQRPESGAHPPANFLAAAGASRRAGDATRLLPWLRDKNKRFRALTDAECDAMFRFASLHRLDANTVIQPADRPPTACFAITSGSVVMRVRRSNGAFRELDRFGAGEVVGLLALVDSRPSPYEILATTTVEVIAFEADRMAQFAAALHPDALAAVKAWTPFLIDHLRSVQQRVARLSGIRRQRIQSRDDDAWKGAK